MLDLPANYLAGVKNFVHNYITQDNRGTAWPICYVVQEEETVHVPDECSDEYQFRDADGGMYEDEADLAKHGLTEDSEGVSKFYVKHQWRDVQAFFTEVEANAYLARDRHNLNENVRLYVDCWRRNTEAEMLLRVMFALAGEDYDKHRK